MEKKRVLVVYYSQTGQLARVVESVIGPLAAEPSIRVDLECVRPENDYPFPWPFFRFLDVFPESVYLESPALKPCGFDPDADYDLIILAYQVWFLSPSLPIAGFLQSASGRRVLAGKPVVTLIACRNMWLTAQERVKELLGAAGARLLDNIALVDGGNSLATFITTPRWLLTGHKGQTGGLLPPAGVAEADIRDSARFGRALVAALRGNLERGEHPLLKGLRAVEVDERLIASERIGYRSFKVWGRLIRAVGPQGAMRRKPLLAIYSVFLVAMILTVVPVTLLLRKALYPLMRSSLQRQKSLLELPSGSGDFRLEEFRE
ncbi:dialkylrecorsinol condensing enzyme [Thiohalomonas denitrificans]|uniref:dialkylrecorsinol condensing enzyme n=1 Tax=Thiohalomonas denitrificans TaxID=415747 RepID=UPI0026EC3449|nr:dialkylrecorsinol condensing enzyme [Thiohalomonas denitrificans]